MLAIGPREPKNGRSHDCESIPFGVDIVRLILVNKVDFDRCNGYYCNAWMQQSVIALSISLDRIECVRFRNAKSDTGIEKIHARFDDNNSLLRCVHVVMHLWIVDILFCARAMMNQFTRNSNPTRENLEFRVWILHAERMLFSKCHDAFVSHVSMKCLRYHV